MTIQEKYLKIVDEVIEKGPYKPDWVSLSEYEAPKWFRDAKFGIFIHWGLFSVPAFNNEWYSRNMYIQDMEEWKHHRETFGEHTKFGYKDFIPMFTAPKFDPKEWVKLFKKAGAKYIMPVAEHHDGFQMYDSEISEWTSVKKAMRRDVLGELKEAIRLILIKIKKQHSPEQIADFLELDLNFVKAVCQIAAPMSPNYDLDKIYETYHTIK